ncbi:sporadically distributed protein, TIGR04141 family [Pseudomonas koreensis]|nr:sporadically distributed protein, TIGR04141 family [Pseudomonas koreensis]
MPRAKKNKEKLSIYLAKNDHASDIEFVKVENSIAPKTVKLPTGSATLYIKKEVDPHPPKWASFLCKDQEFSPEIFGQGNTVGALLVIRVHGKIFALAFGSGYHLIISDSIERDFGLRVTLNSVSPEKLRSLDKSNYEDNPLNSRNQSPKSVGIFELEIDSETDMLYAITGESMVSIFGTQITGRDALVICPEVTLDTLSDILFEALERFKMKLPENFEWVDNISKIKDPDVALLLDMELDERLSVDQYLDHFWLGEPEIVDWEYQSGYSFDQHYKAAIHPTLEIKELARHLQTNSQEKICTKALKKQQIFIVHEEHHSNKSWSAYRCLYAEITYGSEQYILRNGIWYRVNQDFVKRIDNYLSELTQYQYTLPTYNHEREDEYNNYVVANDPNYVLFDKKTIGLGGKNDKIEFCDILRNSRDLIHVKYYRSSSTLSHLFSQGCVAAEAFVSDKEFRKRLNKKLPEEMKLADLDIRPESKKFCVVYAIAVNREIPKKLPFFSKVTLKNAFRTLRALDFEVNLARIEVDAVLACKKKHRKNK